MFYTDQLVHKTMKKKAVQAQQTNMFVQHVGQTVTIMIKCLEGVTEHSEFQATEGPSFA